MQDNELQGLGRSVRLMGLTLGGLVLLVVFQFGLTLWFSASQLDKSELLLSTDGLSARLSHEADILAAGAREYAWWSDTIEKMVNQQDLEWIAYNFGVELGTNYGVEEILVLDPAELVRYSGRIGEHAAAGDNLGWDLGRLRGLIERAQAAPMDAPIPYATFMLKEGALYLVAVCAITSSDINEGEKSAGIRSRSSLIFTSKIDPPRLAAFEKEHGLRNLRWNAEVPESTVNLPVLDYRGIPLGYFSWDIPLPGAALITRVLLWSTPIILSCILLGALLYRRFRTVIRQHQEVTVRSAVIRHSQTYFQSMADDAPVLIWQTDMRGRVVYSNRAFSEVWALTGCAVEPTHLCDLTIADEREGLQQVFEDICDTGHSREYECRLRGDSEKAHWLALVGTPQLTNPGEVASVLFSASDITDRKEAETLAWTRANFDSLTQLPNRNLFQDRLGVELAQAERSGKLLGLMFIDLDNFKNINDSMGHGAGDQVLQQAAKRISACLRKPDTVARLGGDEFVVLMPGVGNRADYGRVAQRIKQTLTSQMTIENVETCLSASIGIAVYPEDGRDAEALMMNADTAMYRAKHNGRNGVVYYDSSMNEELKASIMMETDLRQAMRDQDIFLEYQPIYNSANYEVAGVEALCRWVGKDGVAVPPDKFIPVAERVGLMDELGDYLLVRACVQLKQWLQDGRDIYMAVNISPAQFRDRNFPERVMQLMKEHEIEPSRLQLELTERLLLDDSEDIVRMLNSLAECGVKLAVDDFGTGYSALSYLRRFPVHVLKVDREFVSELPGSTRDQALVKAIITMAHSLGMSVVAEGVETQAQCEFLLQQDCELMQGYLYGRPAGAEELWHNPIRVIPLQQRKA